MSSMPINGKTNSSGRATSCRQALRWNMFGGTLGGPIWKDKLFFFVDYQGQRFDHPTTSNFITVFTNAERNGDFSQISTSKEPGYWHALCQQPDSNVTAKSGGGGSFAFKFYPTPINGNNTNNAVNQVNQAFNSDQGDAKIDWNITQNDRLSARWAQAYQDDPKNNSLAILGNNITHAPVHNAVGTWTHTFSPNILNEARFGASWITITTGTSFDPAIGDLGTQLGIANANAAGPGLLCWVLAAAPLRSRVREPSQILAAVG